MEMRERLTEMREMDLQVQSKLEKILFFMTSKVSICFTILQYKLPVNQGLKKTFDFEINAFGN